MLDVMCLIGDERYYSANQVRVQDLTLTHSAEYYISPLI